ncbi:trigger factor [Pseudomarimonas arenosa]|uniref:Trigger factor n=1 Tax=Pseudomarimonas arenosa TaxID=2774145 RepID=A0AAW3ZKL4_9GAMM|nr:trigger factor [Pseudomarimonas arenosa]MBD8526054.1 trigger factor [Pseudomarimonas arenosa]
MQVSVEHLSNLERKLTVSVPADRLESRISERLREISRTVRLKGFRPGKVPAKVVEQRFGAQIRNEAMSEVIQDSFGEALRQENLRPAVPPSIQTDGKPKDGEFSYVATFEVMPELGPIDVSSLKVKRPTAEVADADIDQMIETLRLQRRTWNPVERAAKDGDLVMFESFVTVGETRVPAEGMERSGTVLGSKAMMPKVEEALVGIATGDERNVEIDFPAEHRNADLAGKTGTMTVRAVRVSEPVLPAVDDAFMASFGVAEGGIEKFRQEVKANLERELKGALMARLKNDVVSRLLEKFSELELPKRMVEAEAVGLANQAEQRAQQQGQKGAKVAPEAFAGVAKQRVAAAVLLGELARQNQIKLDQGRVAEMMASIASTYEDPQQVFELYRGDEQLMRSLESRVVEDQVIDWIADHADLTEEALSFAEVMRPGNAL